MINAIKTNEKDNVIVVVEPINKGESVFWQENEEVKSAQALEDIQIYHKMASEDINKGDFILKYGEHIGIARQNIKLGNHVHSHNVDEQREDLSKVE